jgi:uncharacterized membrane protein
VRASAYGRVLGVPLAALGVGFFLAALVGGLLKVSWQPRLLQVLAGIGVAAALVFLGVQALVLNAWCPWCLVADAAALAFGVRVFWPSAAAAVASIVATAAGLPSSAPWRLPRPGVVARLRPTMPGVPGGLSWSPAVPPPR